MANSSKQGLTAVRQLTGPDRQEIEALAAACRQVDGIDLPLYLEPSTGDETSLFMYYERDVLVGAANAPPGDPIEVVGMVHPEYRRRGIGRTLLRAVRQEGRRRGVSSLLIVCEEAAPSGVAFARAVGAKHQFSEYRMQLDRAAFAPCRFPRKTLELRQAELRDVGALVALWTASSDIEPSKARQAIVHWLGQDNQRLIIGWVQNEPVGMLRLHADPSIVFINSFRVHPELRGRGYGRQILTGVIDQLLSEDWEQILIEVATENANALSLYQSCGFQRVAEYAYYELAV